MLGDGEVSHGLSGVGTVRMFDLLLERSLLIFKNLGERPGDTDLVLPGARLTGTLKVYLSPSIHWLRYGKFIF